MSQNTTVVLDGTGAEVLARMNNALDTVNTLHAGAAAPADAECHVNMLWADTTNNLLKLCTAVGAPSTFITLGQLAANLGMMPLEGDSTINGNITLAAGKKLTLTSEAVEFASASPASAATLLVTGGNLLQPTGTTTITALASAQAGAMRVIRFTTALTLTNGANLILFGKNITTESGDSASFISLGGGQWFLHNYQRADGSVDMGAQFNEAQAANIAAATTTDLASMDGNYAIVAHTSGTVAITALGIAPAGARRLVTFSITGGSLSITHNATSLYLPGANNISVTDGDTAMFLSLGSGNWRMVMLQRNSLAARIWNAVSKTDNYTVAGSDYGNYIIYSATATKTLTLLSAAAAGAGFVFGVRNNNSNSATLSVVPNGSDTVEDVASMTVGVGTSYVLISDGASKWYRMDTGISPATPPAFTTGSQIFTPGVSTFTVPAGIYYIKASQWSGAGAGGGVPTRTGSTHYSGGAGGAGAFAWGIFAVIPSQQYTVTVGAGGVAVIGGNGGNGGTTSFGALLTCTGGYGGTAGSPSSAGTGGAGGTASGSGTLINGLAGTSAVTGTCGAPGGSSAGGVSAGSGASQTPTSTAGTNGASGSGGAAAGVSVTGTTKESGGGGSGGAWTDGSGSAAGGTGGNPGAGGAGAGGGSIAGYSPAVAGGGGGEGKCIVEW